MSFIRSPQTLWAIITTCLLATSQASFAQEAVEASSQDEKSKVDWYDFKNLRVEGKGWEDTKSYYDRLPARAEGVVRPPVWSLSRHSSGFCARFITDATEIKARWKLTSDRLAMPHMPATGVSGLDLYVRAEDGKWWWLAEGAPAKFPVNEVTITTGLEPGTREYMLYLPLYNGVESVEVGLPHGSKMMKPKANSKKPLIFYGTSITHGASASRTGMTHPAIVGRRFDIPVLNLGFSGNGTMDESVVDLLTEIDAAVYIIDCLPNMNAAQVSERTEPLVRKLRKARPDTPILLVEDRTYGDSFLVPSKRERNETSRKALREAYDKLKADGVENLYYLEGDKLLGENNEGTVDSSHPTDLGFWRQADAFQEVLEPILHQK